MPISAFAQPQPLTEAALARMELAGQPVRRSEDIRRRLLVTLLTVGFYYYPSLVTDSLSFFACYHVDRPESGALYADNSRVGFHNTHAAVSVFACYHVDRPDLTFSMLAIPG